MSYFDDASLVMIPSGYKTSKVYSVKPTDGSGDLTFSRSNDTATRVNSAGLIEKVRTNLLTYSEDFANAAWTKSNLSVSSNSVVNPVNGATTADTITADGTSNVHNVQQSTSLFGANYTISVYAKKGTNDFIQIYTDFVNSDYANFDLNAGVVGDKGATTGLTAITSVGNGWYRCSIVTGSASSRNVNIAIVSGTTAARAESNSLATTAFVYGMQLETGDIATDYIATTSAAVSVGPVANVPRLDYLGSSCPRLLLEPQRTNTAQYSEQFDNAYWGKNAVTIVANNATSPSGYQDADLMYPTSAGVSRYALKVIGATSGIAYTTSVFAKASGKNWLGLSDVDSGSTTAWFNLSTGTVGTVKAGSTATITDYGNGWYRCTTTKTSSSTTGIVVILVEDADNSDSITPNGTDGILIWGAQLEAGAYATSYIPTLGASVTRGADAASKTGISSLIGQTEGTLFAEVSTQQAGATASWLNLSDGSSVNWLFIGKDVNKMRAFLRANATTILDSTSFVITDNTPIKVALAYKSGDYALYINGSLIDSGTSSFSFSASVQRIDFGVLTSPVDEVAKYSQALVFKTRLTNAQLAELTTI